MFRLLPTRFDSGPNRFWETMGDHPFLPGGQAANPVFPYNHVQSVVNLKNWEYILWVMGANGFELCICNSDSKNPIQRSALFSTATHRIASPLTWSCFVSWQVRCTRRFAHTISKSFGVYIESAAQTCKKSGWLKFGWWLVPPGLIFGDLKRFLHLGLQAHQVALQHGERSSLSMAFLDDVAGLSQGVLVHEIDTAGRVAAVLNKIVKQVAEEVVLWPWVEDLIGQFPAVAGMKLEVELQEGVAKLMGLPRLSIGEGVLASGPGFEEHSHCGVQAPHACLQGAGGYLVGALTKEVCQPLNQRACLGGFGVALHILLLAAHANPVLVHQEVLWEAFAVRRRKEKRRGVAKAFFDIGSTKCSTTPRMNNTDPTKSRPTPRWMACIKSMCTMRRIDDMPPKVARAGGVTHGSLRYNVLRQLAVSATSVYGNAPSRVASHQRQQEL